jgi:hypothetical protein
LHRARGAVVRDQARIVLYEEPGKKERSERDVGRNRNASWNKGPRLRLRKERTSGRIFRKAFVLEVVKRRVEPSVEFFIRLQEINVKTLWSGRPLRNERRDH